jgi:hypothetical protein
MEQPGIKQRPYRRPVVAPADEPGVADRARFEQVAQAFGRAAGAEEMLDPQLVIIAALHRRWRGGRAVMDLQHVEALDAQTTKALLRRAHDVAGDIAEIPAPNLDLRGDQRSRADLPEHPTQGFLGGAVAVVRCRVEVVDPKLERPRDDAALIRRLPADHQPGIAAAAEADLGEAEVRARDDAMLHSHQDAAK